MEGVPKKGVLRGSGGVKRDAEKGMPKKGDAEKIVRHPFFSTPTIILSQIAILTR